VRSVPWLSDHTMRRHHLTQASEAPVHSAPIRSGSRLLAIAAVKISLTSRLLASPGATAAVMLSALALGACGESAQEKAKAQVCGARTDISNRINTLTGLGLSTNLPSQVKTGVEAIANDITKIKNGQGNLEPARRQQVQTATHTFEARLNSILTGLTSNLSLSNAEAQFKTALSELATSYKQTLAPVNCS
jgi:hypothetical protein